MSQSDTSPEMVTITVDGKTLQAPKGAMLIEVTDKENIRVPRFCYHNKLSVAANCRMCLVDVEKAPKPMPACATPVMDGMVVHTQSENAINAQKSVMEFLLINHPLDCPICDQGGECELQDVSMAYGQEMSQFTEGKHVVFDKNIGPLIATHLTRCIHCTRCVRFGEEIAGIRELGMTGRGENSLIGTFIEQSVTSEMSGNVIDICPVGALTAKPSQYAARAWEMKQHASVAPHDCVGSNIFVHSLRGEMIRVVPRENEDINEVWISDRDRFAYEGVDSEDRLSTPMIKKNGAWLESNWDDALSHVSDSLKNILADNEKPADEELAESTEEAAEEETSNEVIEKTASDKVAALVSPGSTLEELFLAQKLLRAMGSGSIDYRLRQTDFDDETSEPVMPWLGQSIASLENLDAAFLIGSNARKEQPIINHRLRKATLNQNAKIHFLNTRNYEFNYELGSNLVVAQQNVLAELAAITKAAFDLSGKAVPANLKAISSADVTDEHKAIVEQLKQGEKSTVLLGNQAMMLPELSSLRILANAIADETGSKFGYLSDACNTAGASLAGALPYAGPAGDGEAVQGKNLEQLINEPAEATLLLNVEPDVDVAMSRALMDSLSSNNFVVAISAYNSDALKATADVILPAAAFTETSGTFVNVEGHWQSFNGVNQPNGSARPAWKILRVLGNMMKLDGFEQMSSEDVRDECRVLCESLELNNAVDSSKTIKLETSDSDLKRCSDVPMYAADAVVRRATALQKTQDAKNLEIYLNQSEAKRLGVSDVDTVNVKQGDLSAQLSLVIDDGIPDGTAWVPQALNGAELLGHPFGDIVIEKAQS